MMALLRILYVCHVASITAMPRESGIWNILKFVAPDLTGTVDQSMLISGSFIGRRKHR